ncbi:MAG: hypothetical protein AB7L09_01050 [Nitrospira sp.]
MKKRCAECGKTKSVSEFHRKKRGPKIAYNSYCKPCSRKRKNVWYRDNKEGAAKQRQRSREARDRLREEVNELRQNPCVDCGKQFKPWQMQFDHVDPSTKIASISTMVSSATREALFEEIAKCELVCVLCHADRTHFRAQSTEIAS